MAHEEAFLRQFWTGKSNDEKPPALLQIISCAYRPKEKGVFSIPALPGRLYTTREKLYFLSSDGKQFVLPWKDISNIEKEKGFRKVADSAIVVTYTTTDGDASLVFNRLESREEALKHLQDMWSQPAEQIESTPVVDTSASVAPDSILEKMTVVLSGLVKNVSIKDIYGKVWSEGYQTSERPFYHPWLEEEECFDIDVGDWEFAAGAGFRGPWCNESYGQRRVTTFRFKRTTLLYMGPPVASVNQIHHCRVEGNEKCVVAMSVTFEGIPYSDCFCLEMRWVARRVGSGDLEISVGLEVDFKKSTMLRNQIKAATIAETKNVHVRMFHAIKRVCDVDDASTGDIETEPIVNAREINQAPSNDDISSKLANGLSSVPVSPSFLLFVAATFAYPFLWNFFSRLLGAPSLTMHEAHLLHGEIQQLREEVRVLRISVDAAIELLAKRE